MLTSTNIIVTNFLKRAIIFSFHWIIFEHQLSAWGNSDIVTRRRLNDFEFYRFEASSNQESVILSYRFVRIFKIWHQEVLSKRSSYAIHSVSDRLAINLLSFRNIYKRLNFNVITIPDSEIVSDNFIHPDFFLLKIIPFFDRLAIDDSVPSLLSLL